MTSPTVQQHFENRDPEVSIRELIGCLKNAAIWLNKTRHPWFP
jgi:hypothetical protein